MSILICLTSSGTNFLMNISLLALVSPFTVSIDTGTPIILGRSLGSFIVQSEPLSFKRIIHRYSMGGT